MEVIRAMVLLGLLWVSIHLCPKQALEVRQMIGYNPQSERFNPFMPKAGVGRISSLWYTLKLFSFNPFMPKAGVGSFWPLFAPPVFDGFQSIYAQSRRWKFISYFILCCFVLFQSIYAQSRRWKPFRQITHNRSVRVSIHLCPKQALEGDCKTNKLERMLCFNPFMPKAGVGRFQTARR